MKRTVAATIIVALAWVAVARAQAPAPGPAAPGAATPSSNAPAKAPARAKGRTPADARVCLEFPTNAQVIACAEKYRHMKAPV